MSSLNHTLQGQNLLDPEEQALVEAITGIHSKPVDIDFSSVNEAIQQQQPPTPRPVPGTAAPLGMFLSLLAANLGSTLTRRPEMANATVDILANQKLRQQQVEDANAEAMDSFQRGLDKDKISLMLKQKEMELEQAINNGDKDAAAQANVLLKILEDRMDRKAKKEAIAQSGVEDRKTDAARIAAQQAKEQAVFKFKQTFRTEDLPGFGKLDKGAQGIVKQIISDNNRLILMNAIPHYDAMSGQTVPASITVAEALRQQRQNAVEIIAQFASGGPQPQPAADPLGLRRGK